LGWVGALFLAAGLLACVWALLEPPLPKGANRSVKVEAALWVARLGVIGWGMATILARRSRLIFQFHVFALFSLVLLLVLGEVLLRSAISLDVPGFRDPAKYADWFGDDNYWKLHHRWVRKWGPPSMEFVDPLLGWATPKTPENPLGIITDRPYVPDFERPSVLFYGDSFVEGLTSMEFKIPQLLGRKLTDYAVYNFGQGGYGVDQIYLRFRQSHAAFKRPTIVFGILTDDLDRCLLSVRTGQKPYFKLEADRLVLQGLPIDPDQPKWIQQNRPRIWSYFLASLRRKVRLRRARGHPMDVLYRQTEKERINARLIEEVVRECHQHGLPLLFVSFYGRDELERTMWREVFLRQQFQRLGVPFVDAKEVLLRAAAREGADLWKYYRREDWHLNELGNQLVAEAVAEAIRRGDARVPRRRGGEGPSGPPAVDVSAKTIRE
jgi:hypothetical protein